MTDAELEKRAADWAMEDQNYPDKDNIDDVRFEAYVKAYKRGYKKAREWISVKERMPEFDTPVLAMSEFGPFIFEYAKPCKDFADVLPEPYWCLLNFDGTDGLETYSDIEVTHWMPLPDRPEGVE